LSGKLKETALVRAATAAVDFNKPSEALSDLTRLAAELLSCDRAALYARDEIEQCFVPYTAYKTPLDQLGHLPLRIEIPMLQEALQSQLAVCKDNDSGSLGLPLAPGCIACCPCVSSGKPIGLIFVARENKEPFNERDLTILKVISTRSAEALEIEHQISDHKHFFHRLTLLYQASHAIAKTHDLQETIKQVATHLLKASGADVCEVLMLENGESNVSRFEQKIIKGVTHTLASPRQDKIPNYALHNQVLKDLQPATLAVTPPSGSAHDIVLLQSEGFASAAVLPLAIQDQSFGFVRLLYKPRGRSINHQELELAQAVISIGVIGLQDAIHFEASQSRANQLQILSEIGRQMTSTLELENALQSAMRHAQRLLQAEAVILFLKDEKSNQLVLKASGGSHVSIKDVSIPLNEGIAGWVTRNRAPLIVNDVRANPHYMSIVDRHTGLLTTSVVCVPLEEHNHVLGVIEAINHPKDTFSQNDAQVLASVASWAAIALDKARLFRRVAEERSRLEATLVETADAVVLTDPQGRIILINNAAAKAFDIDNAQTDGIAANKIFKDSLIGELLVNEDIDLPMNLEITTPRDRVLLTSLSEISEVGRVAVMQDITALKQIDLMRSQFLGTAAHDLKNPLNAIRLGADLLHEASLTDQQRNALNMMQRAMESMTTLISSLLETIEVESITNFAFELCDIYAFVTSAIEELHPLCEAKKHTLTCEKPDETLHVMGVPQHLNSVICNLLSNAIKFTDPGGEIDVNFEWNDEEIIVHVSDNGPGICDEELPRIFEHFFRGRIVVSDPKNPIEGSGLGLALAKTVVEQHSGKIWVESCEGKGSTFSFSLPRVDISSI